MENIHWIQQDKIDANIWIRWLPKRNFFVWSFRMTDTSTADRIVTMWFRPKYAHVYAIYEWQLWRSESFIMDEWTNLKITTRFVVYNIDDERSLWEGNELSIYSIYIDRDSSRRRFYYANFTDDWMLFDAWQQWWAPANVSVHIFAMW